MQTPIYIGVDGGASKSVIRIETEIGQLIGQMRTRPASLRNDIQQTWQDLLLAIQQLLNQQQINLQGKDYYFAACFGLAGCELTKAYQQFMQYVHPFKTLIVTSDAHIACLGAHAGNDGAIIVIGTGVVGYQIFKQQITQVGGWGFPHDDVGGGAWLGMMALRITLQSHDRRLPASLLSELVLQKFNSDLPALIAFANQAAPNLFATLAPLVIKASEQNDGQAIALLQQSAAAINAIADALPDDLPCTLLGSLAPYIQPYLSPALKAKLRPSLLPPEQGALLYLKQYMAENAMTLA